MNSKVASSKPVFMTWGLVIPVSFTLGMGAISISSLYYGVLGQLGSHITYGTFIWQWSVVGALAQIGGVPTAFLLPRLEKQWGVKDSLVSMSAVFAIAWWLQMLTAVTNSLIPIMLGQFIFGILVSVWDPFLILFFKSIAPSKFRARFNNASYALRYLGMGFQMLIGFPEILGSANRWPWLLVMGIITVCPSVFAAFLVPSEPRFLRNKDDIYKSTLFYKGLQENSHPSSIPDERSSHALGSLFRSPENRRGLMFAVLLSSCVEFGGRSIVKEYFTLVLSMLGNSNGSPYALLATVLTPPCTYFMGHVSDKYGRLAVLRPGMVISTSIVAAVTAIRLTGAQKSTAVMIIGTILVVLWFITTFSMLIPMHMMIAEPYSSQVGAAFLGIYLVMQCAQGAFIAALLPILENKWEGSGFLLQLILLTVTGVPLWVISQETKPHPKQSEIASSKISNSLPNTEVNDESRPLLNI